jgi:hypothetical protein
LPCACGELVCLAAWIGNRTGGLLMATRSESRQKTKLIQVRCTPDEKAVLQARAAAFGVSMTAKQASY